MSEGKNRKLVVIYALIGIAIISVATLATLKLIYNLWFPPFFNIATGEIPVQVKQMSALSEGFSIDNRSILYRNITNYDDGNHFHKIPITIRKDNIDRCVTCHGNVPHFINEDKRAFLNKHSLYLSCETCHVQKTDNNTFVWYNINSGELLNSLTLDAPMINTDTKIALLDKNATIYDHSEKIKAGKELLAKADTLSKSERENILKRVHEGNITDTKKAITCENCHTNKSPYLPFEKLGYSKERISQILSSDVVQMVLKYKEFYLPTIISGSEEQK